jgi:MFS transporter, OCT family, solute carrier family 22 (organic cation transporter), member 4/5
MYFFSRGIEALAGIAMMFQPSWRLIYAITSLPSLVFVLIVKPFVFESLRWYLMHGCANNAMCDIVSTNGRCILDNVMFNLDDKGDDVNSANVEELSLSGKIQDTL